MEALTFTLSLALGAGTLALILYPLWQSHARDFFTGSTEQHTLANYEARYQATLAAIKALMFDYEMGKVSEEDYHPLLTQAKLEAADIRQQIDRLNQQQAAVEIDAGLDAEIETLIAQTRSGSPNGSEALRQAVEAEIESLKDLDAADLACPNCGRFVGEADAFCSGCGQALDDFDDEDEIPADTNHCPTCGATVQPDDAFCAQCGTPLRETTPTQAEEASL